ncbi:hypothetical protein MNBD_GAMMA22-234 [hydrothermal vent metagenome]|uniref:Uncharacterized protein n=1 Tax=hydrothermal vent metagenome TaxID=652676 RepID=A0A3B0ZZ91_9ZZZZ
MTKTPQLPDDVDALKALLSEKNAYIDNLEVKVITLQEQLNIKKLYKIEKSLKTTSVDERFKIRQALAVPILTQCRT